MALLCLIPTRHLVTVVKCRHARRMFHENLPTDHSSRGPTSARGFLAQARARFPSGPEDRQNVVANAVITWMMSALFICQRTDFGAQPPVRKYTDVTASSSVRLRWTALQKPHKNTTMPTLNKTIAVTAPTHCADVKHDGGIERSDDKQRGQQLM